MSVLSGKLIQVLCTPLLTRIGPVSGSTILHGKHLIKASGVRQRPGWSRPDSTAHRLQCGTVHDKQNGLGQSKAHRDPVLVAVRNNKLTGEKIPSETNSSDLGTKHLTSERSEMLMKLVSCFYV